MSNSNFQAILEFNGYDARNFFLKSESYCSIDLPPYYTFQNIIDKVSNFYEENLKNNKDFYKLINVRNAKETEGVNYHIYANKDGSLSWRELQIIHPALYVHLVYVITERDNWDKLINRFKIFQKNCKIQCLSIPLQSLTRQSNKAVQIQKWWQNVEQKSIELALEFNYLYDTDIADCYGSIYTHSIAWAIETKEIAKEKRTNKSLLGNSIDSIIGLMQQGQTNGIPQGSVVMDFIAEIILGYVDEQLSIELTNENIDNYKILRYRDDYRIFVNNPKDGSNILKILSRKLLELGMRLNSAKTKESNDVITTAIKADKIDWLNHLDSEANPQQQILIIRQHSKRFPNSGTLKKQLQKFYEDLDNKLIHKNFLLSIVSIVTDICYNNPSTYTVCFAIISKLLDLLDNEKEVKYIIDIMFKKFNQLPNIGYMQIWFKRMIINLEYDFDFKEILCDIDSKNNNLWDNNWISSSKLKNIIINTPIVNIDKYNSLDNVIQINEFSLFSYDDKK